ncbi:MAG: DUF3368 domain-containing protein [Candidatus Acidulodesulfobacterium ferriphilum]|uniref:DUF3368 domain-containing protein n=1 Tax=Candidatus Acidulodesulfobacterium ferriphilum TaxID=2597223 RepID=A0A519BAU4_9DELT|nr:MAG: DUF3368 domain-containing protein [Candidatus Acidulodesulfobacterium ferriphilum]
MGEYLLNDICLGQGELEAIALCKAINADFLIIDDRLARKAASANNIKITGSLGILLSAKKKGYINTIKPCIESRLIKKKVSDLFILLLPTAFDAIGSFCFYFLSYNL